MAFTYAGQWFGQLAANTTYNVYVLNSDGLSPQSTADEYTTKPQL